jgi:protocatechuate 3,4-dioxygenase beta subunit
MVVAPGLAMIVAMQHDRHRSSPLSARPLATADDPTSALGLAGVIGRRRLLGLFGAAVGAAVVSACGGDESTASSTAAPSSTSGATATTTAATDATATTAAASATTAASAGTVDVDVTPSETGGPFPSDGSNDNGAGETANMLAKDGVIRSDIRADIGGANVQDGVPMTLTVTVLDAATDTPKAGAAVYVWHCNREGVYSQYDSPMLGGDYSDVTWLRGVQLADANGVVTFQTILPGRYQGRAAHIHFEVYSDDTYASSLLTSQMAFDDDQVDGLYEASGYRDALAADTDNADDGVFGDGVEDQLLTITGDVTSGLAATITVGV